MPWTNSWSESPQKDEVMNIVDRMLFCFGYSLTTKTWPKMLATVPRILPKYTAYLTMPECCQSPSQCGKTLEQFSTLHCAASALLSCLAFKPIHLHLQEWLCKVPEQCLLLSKISFIFFRTIYFHKSRSWKGLCEFKQTNKEVTTNNSLTLGFGRSIYR